MSGNDFGRNFVEKKMQFYISRKEILYKKNIYTGLT